MPITQTVESPAVERSTLNVTSQNLVRMPDFSTQYFRTYCVRLKCQSSILKCKIAETWGESANFKQLCDIVSDEKCVVIGTVYKEMANKPSVLKELTESYQLGVRENPLRRFTSQSDRVFLEDSQQRIELQLDKIGISAGNFVTGVVLAVLGHEPEQTQGHFIAEEILYPTPSSLPPSVSPAPTTARLVAIISGLRLSDGPGNCCLPLRLFFDWLSGTLPIGSVHVEPATVGRLIVAGNLFESDPNADHGSVRAQTTGGGDPTALELFDQLVATLCPSIPVDVMSGPTDPTSVLLPQKPMHPVLFPHSSRWSSFTTRPNPWMFSLDDGRFGIGIAGQTVDDIDKYCDIDDPLDRLAVTVKWGHAAPTAPDTLPSYPNVAEVDPLIIPHQPSLYFAGNQDSFQWRRDPVTNSLLVTVPRFKDTGEVVLVDMENMSCRSLVFR